MLILSRRPQERIIIGDNVSIIVLDIMKNNVKLGIDAPIEISVHREEIYNKLKKQKEEKINESTKSD